MIVRRDFENFMNLSWLKTFMKGHHGFICGGCFKNIFNKEKVKDLDIFFRNENDWKHAVNYFDSMTEGYVFDDVRETNYIFLYENSNVKAYKHIKTGINVELCNKIYGTPEEIIKQFDFTITKFALVKSEINTEDELGIMFTEEIYDLVLDDHFFEHLHQKRLVIDENIPYPMSTFERMIRYAKYGYFPCKETKMKLIRSIWDLEESELNLSNSLYDGMD